jgi:molybdopterin synthase catalytic subunit
MAQTAVSWLINYCERENWSLPSDIEEIAKAMEKEQIEESFKQGALPTFLGIPRTSEQYYNETYNK